MREHKDIVLPSGKTAKLKKELTAREHEQLELAQVSLYKMKFDPSKRREDQEIVPADTGDILGTMRHTLIKVSVIEVEGGKGEDILADVLDGLSRPDYDALLAGCREVANVDETGNPTQQNPKQPKQGKNGSPTSAEEKQN